MGDMINPFDQVIDLSIGIKAASAEIWDTLTKPDLMKQWMSETDINIITDWKIGSPITIRGELHSASFENKGFVLQFKTAENLVYSHLSSLSDLEDKTGNYSIIEFKLTPAETQTILSLKLSNFPTESIYRHLAFYWRVTLELLKKFIEK